MRNHDRVVMRSVDRGEAPPGWALGAVAVVQARPGERYDRPRHRHHTVECVLAGRGLVRVGREQRICEPGDSYHLPFGRGHLIEADTHRPWRKIYCVLHGPFFAQLKAAYGIHAHIFPAIDLAHSLRAMLDHRGDDRSLQLLAGRCMQTLVATWAERAADAAALPGLVREAKRLIDEGLERPLRLRDLARNLHCSEAHLSRQFRTHLGLAPGAYQLQRRMELARSLLAGTAEPVKTIAARLCYSDAFAFSHAFKQRVGMSPMAWRRQ